MGILLSNTNKLLSNFYNKLIRYQERIIFESTRDSLVYAQIKRRSKGYYFNDYKNYDNYFSIYNLLETKIIDEIMADRYKDSILDIIREIASQQDVSYFDSVDWDKLDFDDFQNLIVRYDLDLVQNHQILSDYQKLRNLNNRIRAIKIRIKTALNRTLKFGRNLKEVFATHHSFHFKNLDDCHINALVNNQLS
ncbi:hypothetical protein [Flagellimonas aurea]|uniref:hypothetical protein n=1 Tax=Flagellimonas aurea TaxID=2915619 RepID=UPI0035CFE330